MIKVHTAYNDIRFSITASKIVDAILAKVHPSERRYVTSALSDEYDSIQDAIEYTDEHHDYMLASDVQRVLTILKLN